MTQALIRSRLLGLSTMLLLLFATAASGQILPVSTPSPEARAQLFSELARDVEALERQGNILKRVVRLVKPTVVHIDASKVEEDGIRRRRVQEAGSGVIVEIGKKYYVLTNRHVIHGTPLDQIKIQLHDARILNPQRIWTDKDTDLAVMQIDARNLVAARLGDSDKLEIGDFVLAMGSPFGLSHSVTYGIISAKGRRDLSLGREGLRFQDFIQTDAAINPGNSGGPLMNLRGEVVGINTAIASNSGGSEGIGFTIPVNMARFVARQLVERGRVSRAFFGVHLDSRFSPEAASRLGLPAAYGARVNGITPSSPAESADVKVGDVILQFNGVRIEDDNHLVNVVSLTPIGEDVQVIVFRDGEPKTITAKVGARSDFNLDR